MNKPMAALSYADGEIQFPSLSILLPLLPVKSYDPDSGKLVLSLQGLTGVYNKLLALQTMMLQKSYANYRSWFPGDRERTHEDISSMFQPLVAHGCIYLYCPLLTSGPFNEIKLYSGATQGWVKGKVPSSVFSAGAVIRVAVRLQGISFHQHPISRMWTGKSRVQHRILAVYTD